MNPGGTRLIPEESYTESGEYTVSIDILGKELIDFFSLAGCGTHSYICNILGSPGIYWKEDSNC